MTSRKNKVCWRLKHWIYHAKQPCQFFDFTFLSLLFKFSVHPSIFINPWCLIPFQNINLHLLLPLKWIVHDMCTVLLIHLLISLFPVICFKLPITHSLFQAFRSWGQPQETWTEKKQHQQRGGGLAVSFATHSTIRAPGTGAITRTFFDFPRRFEFSGVRLYWIEW